MKHLHRLTTLTAALLLAVNAFAQLEDVPVETGQYTPDWDYLSIWECPDWFRDAKFGIWAHWDPQCQAEDGDWYARNMYGTNNHQWNRFREVVGSYPTKKSATKIFADYGLLTNGIHVNLFSYTSQPVPAISWRWASTTTTSTAGTVPIRNGTP